VTFLPRRHDRLCPTGNRIHRWARPGGIRDAPDIAYWRDAVSGREVNIIVKSPASLLPFEVKYRERAPVDAKSGLAVYSVAEGVKQAYLVTKQDADFGVSRLEGIDTQFLKVPAHVLCYLLRQAERQLWK